MRDPQLIETRNQDIQRSFNEAYKSITHGTSSAKYNIAVRQTAEKFYLSIRSVQRIISGG